MSFFLAMTVLARVTMTISEINKMNPLRTFYISLLTFGALTTLCAVSRVFADSRSYDELSNHAHYEDVLGTSLDINIYGVPKVQADTAISKTLKEIQRLENILSTWKKDSHISQLNIAGKAKELPTELIQVISQCEKWRTASNKKFSCRMGNIKQLWLDAEKNQQVPDRIKVRYQARDIRRAKLTFDLVNNQVELDKVIKLDLAGLAKGFVIDHASSYLHQLIPKATGIKLDIGGDAYYWGQPLTENNWKVVVAQPNFIDDAKSTDVGVAQLSKDGLNNQIIINLQSMAVASSGHNSRYREIERRRFSHILDPRDGWPMNSAPSATVIAKNAVTADAVATALSTQPAAQGIDWVNQLDNVEAIIMLPDGIKVASKGWHTYLQVDDSQINDIQINDIQEEALSTNNQSDSTQHNSKNDNAEPLLPKRVSNNSTEIKNTNSVNSSPDKPNSARPSILIKYQIPDRRESNKYHKPYVAIWISDRSNKSVRNLLLLGESNRWVKENTRWWRRVGRKNRSLVDGIARPTRRPGEYQLFWDGLDDFGKFDQSVQYFLNVEAAREGGGHDYQKIEFEFGSSVNTNNIPQPILLAAKGEVGTVTLTYTIENTHVATNKVQSSTELYLIDKASVLITTSHLANNNQN